MYKVIFQAKVFPFYKSLHVLGVERPKNLPESPCEAHDCECGWPNYGRERGLACRNPLSSINPTVPAVLKEAGCKQLCAKG